jgi:adenylate cyclase
VRRAVAETLVRAPAQRIWDLYADLEGTPRWVPFVEAIVWSSGPLEVGMRYRERTSLGGISGVQEWRVVELEPPRRRVETSSSMGMESGLIIEMEPDERGTRLRQVSELRSRLPGPIGWLHERLFAAVARRAMVAALEGARREVESQDDSALAPTAKTGQAQALDAIAVATQARVPLDEVERMTRLGILEPDGEGYRPSDIMRVRTANAYATSGLDLDDFARGMGLGVVSLRPMDLFYPSPVLHGVRTLGQLAAELEATSDEVASLLIAAGLTVPPVDDPLREDDARIVATLHGLAQRVRAAAGPVVAAEFGERLARILGDGSRRMAAAGVGLYDEILGRRTRSAGQHATDAERQRLNELGADVMAAAPGLVTDLFLHHLEQVVVAWWTAGAEEMLDRAGIRPAERPDHPAVAFVDLSGYTRTTEEGGDELAARLATRLATLADRVALARDASVVKLLGDGVMLRSRWPADMVRAALDLVDAVASEGLPAGHAGVHCGPMVERDGDLYGRTVNLAARISATAPPGSVLVSEAVAGAGAPDLHFDPAGVADLRGVASPVPLYRAAWAAADQPSSNVVTP